MRHVRFFRTRSNNASRTDYFSPGDAKMHRDIFKWAGRGVLTDVAFTSFHASTKHGTMFRGYRRP